jgi:hypothetical protein
MLFNLAYIVQPECVAANDEDKSECSVVQPSRGGKDMKRYAALSATTIFAAILSQLTPITPAEAQSIPAPSGRYSFLIQGQVTDCLDPTTHAAVACSTSGAAETAFSVLQIGHIYYASGNGCEEVTQVVNYLPPNATPPIVNSTVTGTVQITSYDPNTGLGTKSFTRYSGGSCNGANFNSAGATEISFGTLSFVATDGGKREDEVVTQLEAYPTNNAGTVSLLVTEQKQTP